MCTCTAKHRSLVLNEPSAQALSPSTLIGSIGMQPTKPPEPRPRPTANSSQKLGDCIIMALTQKRARERKKKVLIDRHPLPRPWARSSSESHIASHGGSSNRFEHVCNKAFPGLPGSPGPAPPLLVSKHVQTRAVDVCRPWCRKFTIEGFDCPCLPGQNTD